MKYLAVSVLFCLEASAAVGPGLKAGLARIDITPPAGHVMGGYASRTGGAAGTHDPLYATVLVLEGAGTSLALVTCDLRSFVSTRVGELAKQRFGIAYTIISASHTHAGPLTWEARTPWYTEAEDKMVDGIGEAKRSMFPARVGADSGRVSLGFNRRKVVDGKVEMWWRNAERSPSHPVDPAAHAVRISDDKGNVRAVLVNYACHPSVLGPDNLQYSAGYPGAMRRYVESQLPGALCLFLQGAAGDINPYRDKEPVAGDGFQSVEEMGEALGREVVSLVGRAGTVTSGDAPLRLASEVVEVNSRWNPEERIKIGLTAGILGSSVCFVALPGEPFVEHQVTLREKSDCATAMLFGYSYSAGGVWAGYLPTVEAAAEGGYGADYNTVVAVGAGEMLVDRGVVRLFELRGMLKDLPEARF